MPEIGDLTRGKDIGVHTSPKSERQQYVYVECPVCKERRWTQYRANYNNRERACMKHITQNLINTGRRNIKHGPESKLFKGYRHFESSQRVWRIWLPKDDPFRPMANCKGIIVEHRLVMARHLNRLLSRKEHVHHINGDSTDNHLENLELISPANHMMYDKMCAHCKMRHEVKLLKDRIKSLEDQIPKMI